MTISYYENISNTVFSNGIVEDWMEDASYFLQIHDPINKAAEMMSKHDLTHLVVVNEVGTVKGIVTFSIIMRALLDGFPQDQELHHIMNKQFTACYTTDPINKLSFQLGTRMPVIDKNGRLIGHFPSKNKLINRFFDLAESVQSLEHLVDLYQVCFDTAYEGITVVDQNGYIQLFNDAYSRYVQMSKEEVIGKHCTEVIENTRLPIVLKTGIPERNNAVILQGQEMIANVLPIWREDKVIGALGMLVFEGVSELSKAFDRVQTLKDQSRSPLIQFDYPKKNKETMTFDKIVGESHSIGYAKKIARRAATTTAKILLVGESGVGKELFAKAIHNLSPVKNGPMIAINCAAIPDELLESELFGYNAGAFTGANKGGKPGKFELAHNGTLFLDEIGDMPLPLQAKLLRVLQEQKFERVGGINEINVNVRIIAATNQPLEKLVEKGTFRKDLFYRLNIIRLEIPPLRDRKTDIPILVSKLLEACCTRYQIPPVKLSKDVMEVFIHYDWPGNVRELANLLESIVILSDQKLIQLEDLPSHIKDTLTQPKTDFDKTNKATDLNLNNATLPFAYLDLDEQVRSFPSSETNLSNSTLLATTKVENQEREREMISTILQKTAGNKSKAAQLLGIHRSTLYKKIVKYHLI